MYIEPLVRIYNIIYILYYIYQVVSACRTARKPSYDWARREAAAGRPRLVSAARVQRPRAPGMRLQVLSGRTRHENRGKHNETGKNQR